MLKPIQFDGTVVANLGFTVGLRKDHWWIEFGVSQLPGDFTFDVPPRRISEMQPVVRHANIPGASRNGQRTMEIDRAAIRSTRFEMDGIGETRDGQCMRSGLHRIGRFRWHRRDHDEPGTGPLLDERRDTPSKPRQMRIAPDRIDHSHAYDDHIGSRFVELVPSGQTRRFRTGFGSMLEIDPGSEDGLQHAPGPQLDRELVAQHEYPVTGFDDRSSDGPGEDAQQE